MGWLEDDWYVFRSVFCHDQDRSGYVILTSLRVVMFLPQRSGNFWSMEPCLPGLFILKASSDALGTLDNQAGRQPGRQPGRQSDGMSSGGG